MILHDGRHGAGLFLLQHWLPLLALFLCTVYGSAAEAVADASAQAAAAQPSNIRVVRMGMERVYSTSEKTVDKALARLNINLAGRQVYP